MFFLGEKRLFLFGVNAYFSCFHRGIGLLFDVSG
jgi:hypothetical protein